MDTEDLLPRLALFAGIVTVIMLYRKRTHKRIKQVQAPGLGGTTAASAIPAGAAPAPAATGLAERGQTWFENVLDNIAEEAMKELKTAVKDGLKRLEKTVDQL